MPKNGYFPEMRATIVKPKIITTKSPNIESGPKISLKTNSLANPGTIFFDTGDLPTTSYSPFLPEATIDEGSISSSYYEPNEELESEETPFYRCPNFLYNIPKVSEKMYLPVF
jgi:hypothetical protein